MNYVSFKQTLKMYKRWPWHYLKTFNEKVTLAVYFYFLAALFGTQWVTPASSEAYEKIYKTYGRCDLIQSTKGFVESKSCGFRKCF